MLDDAGQPIALHHAGFGTAEQKPDTSWPRVPDELLNAAVPLDKIKAKIAGDMKKIQDEGRIVLSRGCLDGRRPMFGRSDLLAAIEKLASGEHRVLWVKPPPDPAWKRPGKTFSVEVLKAVLPPPKNIFIEFTADQVKAGGREMVQLILKTLDPQSTLQLPTPEEGATTETAFFENHLFVAVRETIGSNFAHNLIWLVIDDLDVHNLTDAGGRRFLDVLYNRVADIPQLRIALIGLKVYLPSIPESVLLHSPIEAVELDAIGELFQNWLAERGARNQGIAHDVITFLSELATSFAGTDAPLEALARFTIDHLTKPLNRFLGPGTP